MRRSSADIADAIGQLQAMQALLHRRQLRLIAEYDRMEAWREDGATSMAAWLSYFLNATHATGAEEARIAASLESLPAIASAYSNGELSRDQLRALTRFATPETDESLRAEAPKMSAAQTYRVASRCRPMTTEEEQEAHRTRSLKLWWDEHLLHMSGRLPKAEGAVVAKALERIAMQAQPDPVTDLYEPFERRCADALVELASIRLADDGDADRATVAVHVDAAVLAGADGVAELADGDAIAAETARRLACDARWSVVVDGLDGTPVGVGRTTRQVPTWLMRQLKRRDIGCTFPGCGRRRWVAAHHVVHWARGGPSDLNNLVLLCGTHHRLVHEGGAELVLDDCGPSFVLPNGRVVCPHGPPALRDEWRCRLAGEDSSLPAATLLDTG